MGQDKDEKTEKPTGRRLDDAKKKGDVARSQDLGATLGLFLTILFFAIFTSYFARTFLEVYKKYFAISGTFQITENSAYMLGKDFFIYYLQLLLPLFVLLIAVAVVAEIIQAGGIIITTEKLKIKWDKLFIFPQILPGLKKVLGSVEALFDLFKSLVKVFFIGIIAYLTIQADIPEVFALPETSLDNILSVMGLLFLKLAFNITLFLLILSILDYMWQKHRYIEKLKMSKQDIKDEYKQLEGDPLIKGKQKQMQFQRAMQRMMTEVPQADVVITNPTHYAVALKYEYQKMKSPKLLAKGKDLMAQKIKEVAKKHGVPIVENPPVARGVFASVEIGDLIPADLFKPVAEILAYIYKLKGKKLG
ncbi:MAG: flagellar biosynthesis protein FlhB [bacterium]|nr:flagellar biosynthesis protein FlhB [bacterium]